MRTPEKLTVVAKTVLTGVTLGFLPARFKAPVAAFNAEITPS